MGRKVAIVDVSQTKYGIRKDLHIPELAFEPVEDILNRTGLKFTEDGTGIDSTVSCSDDFWDGRTISAAFVTDVAGGHLRHEVRLEADGLFGIYHAMLMINAGQADVVLVVSCCKESQADARAVENMSVDPIFLRPLGLDFLSGAALQSNLYTQKYGITAEQCAKVVVKNRRNARSNPYAQAPAELDISDVINSEMLALPIRTLDKKPTSDGACAVIVASEQRARKITDKPVWISAISDCYDSHYLGERDLSDCLSLRKAAQNAYKKAGITDPVKQTDLVELSEEYSYQELLWCEGLGLCGPGQGGKLIDSGATRIGGKIPVNPSGGMISGNPVIVAGMARVVEAVLQLQGRAGSRQIDGAGTAVVQGCHGICGQHQCVGILTNAEGSS